MEEEKVDGLALARTVEQLAHLAAQSETESLINALNDFLPSGGIRSTPPPDMTSVV